MSETRQTVFRQTPGEYEKLKNDAHAHRMNISEYLRFLVEMERERMNNAEKNIKWNSEKEIQDIKLKSLELSVKQHYDKDFAKMIMRKEDEGK